MGLSGNYFVDQWLIPTLVIFLLIGSVFAFIVGLGLILRSATMFRFFGTMNRWVSLRKVMRTIEIPRDTDSALHGQSRTLGGIFVVGAGVSLVALVKGFDVAAIVSAFRPDSEAVVIEMATQAVKWMLLVGNAFAIAVGIAMIAAPHTLAGLETRANQWYSTRKYDRNADAMHMGFENWAMAHPRAIGWTMLVLSTFVFVNLSALLLGPN